MVACYAVAFGCNHLDCSQRRHSEARLEVGTREAVADSCNSSSLMSCNLDVAHTAHSADNISADNKARASNRFPDEAGEVAVQSSRTDWEDMFGNASDALAGGSREAGDGARSDTAVEELNHRLQGESQRKREEETR